MGEVAKDRLNKQSMCCDFIPRPPPVSCPHVVSKAVLCFCMGGGGGGGGGSNDF